MHLNPKMTRRSFMAGAACALASAATTAWAEESKGKPGDDEDEAQKEADTSKWSYGGVTVSYPSSWESVKPEGGAPQSPNSLALAIDGRDAVAVNVNDANGMPVSNASDLELIASMMAASILQSDDLEDVSVGQFSVEERDDGSFACTIPFEASQGGDAYCFAMHMAAKGTVMVAVSVSAPEADWDGLSDDFTKVFDSVEFGEPERFDGSKLEEVGDGSVTVSTRGGTTDGGNVPKFSAGDASMMQVGIDVEGVEPGGYASYVDGLANTVVEYKDGLAMVQTSLTLTGDALATGIHTVELVRMDGDAVAFYRRVQYEVE